jgi:alpha-tubulin suppressor-like RCC1 family protein
MSKRTKENEQEGDAQPTKRLKRTEIFDGETIIYAVGCNEFGQLGLGPDLVRSVEPKKIVLEGTTAPLKLIGCGFSHSFLVTDKNEIFSCGRNERGQLGLGH